MKNINAPVRSNGYFAHQLYRENPASSWLKRQSRRQDRRMLATALREQAGQILSETMEMAAVTRSEQSAHAIQPTAVILQFPTNDQRKDREVLVIRKLPRAEFRRQEVAVDLLAA